MGGIQPNVKHASTTMTSFPAESASFLEESSFEIQNADPSFENLFNGDTSRFKNRCFDNSTTIEISKDNIDVGLLSIQNTRLEATPTKKTIETLDINKVTEKEILDALSNIYSYICLWNMIPNVTLEIYFLFTVLTTRIPVSSTSSSSNKHKEEPFQHPFVNLESYVYFAVSCLEKLKQVVVILDVKSLLLLFENSRMQQFTNPEFLEYLECKITTDETMNLSMNFPASVKSPNTGIAFQTESDNRKSFISDRHFYSFSKKRDAFYSIVRQWEENIGDPEWNLTNFLSRKVGELMRTQDGLNNDFQFARLFTGQLVEMYKNQVGDKTEEPETSDGVLLELKKRDPMRFQSLQNRLTGPSSTCDPCPKLTFTKVEEFFKEFIRIADSYSFNKCLIQVLLQKIKAQDSNTFGLDQHINSQQLNKSDFSDTLWQDVKSTISELRLYAKFLGFVVFLPYHQLTDTKELVCSREMTSESLNLKLFIENAASTHRLLISIPWVVDLLSMADKNAFHVACYREPLHLLLKIYRQFSLKLKRCDSSHLLTLTLSLHIGWLFDQNPSDQINFYEFVFPHGILNEGGEEDEDRRERMMVVGLDDIIVVDKNFVNMMCPYLKVIKRPLSDFKKKVALDNSSGKILLFILILHYLIRLLVHI